MKGNYSAMHKRIKRGITSNEVGQERGEKVIGVYQAAEQAPVKEVSEEPVWQTSEESSEEIVPEEAVSIASFNRKRKFQPMRTVRLRKKIGQEMIEKGIQEQKDKICEQISQLPKVHRKAFLEALLEKVDNEV